jgi:hypothetical protein
MVSPFQRNILWRMMKDIFLSIQSRKVRNENQMNQTWKMAIVIRMILFTAG